MAQTVSARLQSRYVTMGVTFGLALLIAAWLFPADDVPLGVRILTIAAPPLFGLGYRLSEERRARRRPPAVEPPHALQMCPSCGTRNDWGLMFCKECSQGLSYPESRA